MPPRSREKSRVRRDGTSGRAACESPGAADRDVTIDGDTGSEAASPQPGASPAEVSGYDSRIRRFALARLRNEQ
jgi:hypothetical protein